MKIADIFESFATNLYIHGGPYPLDGDSFKRGGRGGHDMGALFFSRYTESGIKYSMGYAISRNPKSWALYLVKLNIPDGKVFDFTNPSHREIARKVLSPQEFESWDRSSGNSGHLDWTSVDEELFEDMGFRAAYFHERSAGLISDDHIISIGVFNSSNVKIVKTIPAAEAKKKFKHLIS